MRVLYAKGAHAAGTNRAVVHVRKLNHEAVHAVSSCGFHRSYLLQSFERVRMIVSRD